MHIQVNSNSSVSVPEDVEDEIIAVLHRVLERFSADITRLEVHLGDVNARKGGIDDKRCALEARLAGLQPITVDHHASTLQLALDGAAGKMQRALDSTLGKLRQH